MKKIILVILSLCLLCGCTSNQQNESNVQPFAEPVEANYVKAIWITYYELQEMMSVNEAVFRSNVENAFNELADFGFNTACVQVRPCADAFYYSKYYPASKYCFGRQGGELPFDPLKIICEIANAYNIKIEAWINPYRVSQESSIDDLSDDNIAKKWYSNKKTKSYVYKSKQGIYFNPAADEVTDLIVNGVEEIVENYDISAIHFDDYFYPTTDKSIDELQYKSSKMTLADFRRSKVSNMVSSVYKAIKAINPNVRFGISPASNINNDYNTLYADVGKWASVDGYIDYICPQVYFGFKNVYQPFMFTVKKWSYITKCDMYVGLPLYKAGKRDKYAAQNEVDRINEFKNNSNIIARQIKYLSSLDEVKGYYVFSYSSLHDKTASKEVENMKAVMQSSNPQ